MKKLNLNSFIKVKLTPSGIDVYYNYHNNVNKRYLAEMGLDYREKNMPNINDDGFTEMLLWKFMKIFGSAMNMVDPILVDEVSLYIKEEDLKDV